MRAPLSRALFRLLALLFSLAAAAPALADGKVFPTFNHQAAIPDQQALITYQSGVETLAIETRFTGTGTDFAWVVPLPAPPEISPATTGLFPSLRAIFTPEIKSGYGLVGFLLALILLMAVAVSLPKATCLARILAFVFLLLLFIVIFLPALGKSRGVDSGPGIAILDRQIVGSFETTTITGASADPLLDWLKQNGFEQPQEIKPVLADYIARGWCFVATKLRRDTESGIATPHPLVFRFPTPAPVYPLKLTGTSGKPVTVELYIFGPGTATAPGFDIVRSFSPDYQPEQETGQSWRGGGTVITHSAVATLAAGAPVATCLKGTLSPARMTADSTILFGPPNTQRRAVYTSGSAWAAGFDVGMWVLLAGTVLLAATMAIRRRGDVHLGRPILYALLPAIIAMLITALVLPKAPGTTDSTAIHSHFVLQDLATYLQIKDGEENAGPGPHSPRTVGWARARITQWLEDERINGVSYPHPPREEDSPGNYTLHQTEQGLELHIYTWNGGEYVVPV